MLEGATAGSKGILGLGEWGSTEVLGGEIGGEAGEDHGILDGEIHPNTAGLKRFELPKQDQTGANFVQLKVKHVPDVGILWHAFCPNISALVPSLGVESSQDDWKASRV